MKTALEICQTSRNNLTRLSLFKFSDSVEEGERILHELTASNINSLERLDLGGNPTWFTTSANVESLC